MAADLTEEERFTAFDTVGDGMLRGRDAYNEILSRFGHSPEEIERMLPE